MKLTKESRINSEFLDEEIHGKMPVFCCSCGVKILIVPDLLEMKKVIENHIVEHKKLSGQILTKDNLTQQVLGVLIDSIKEI